MLFSSISSSSLPTKVRGITTTTTTTTTTIILLLLLSLSSVTAAPPLIILSVIVDDLGHHNVGWNQNVTENQPYYAKGLSPNENTTPHLTNLAQEGIILNRLYAHFTCTPSRSSFLSGRLPVHVQQTLANPDVSTAGIPRNMTALPEILTRSNYVTNVIGKWDVGFATSSHTPEGRGFNTSLVYAEHMNYYWTQRICPTGTGCSMDKYANLVDFWDTGKGASTLNGTAYIEYLFRDRLMEIINNYDGSHPLYIHFCPHSGHWPLQVPEEWYNKFLDVENDETDCGGKIPWVWPGANHSVLSCRRQYVAMIALVDEIVGNLTNAIKAKGYWNQTLMTFSSDNGASISPDENSGSSYPLRGGKYQPMEGGIRIAGFVSGGYLPSAVQGTILNEPMHITDWYSTFAHLVNQDPTDHRAAQYGLPPIDSLNMWPLLSGQNMTSPRTEIPVSPNVLLEFATDGQDKHVWKLIQGTVNAAAGWMSPLYPNSTSPANNPYSQQLDCSGGPNGACLFDVWNDPSEYTDVAAQYPSIVSTMVERLKELAKSFYSNNETGVKLCPANVTDDCMCWLGANKYGGFLGPWEA